MKQPEERDRGTKKEKTKRYKQQEAEEKEQLVIVHSLGNTLLHFD